MKPHEVGAVVRHTLEKRAYCYKMAREMVNLGNDMFRAVKRVPVEEQPKIYLAALIFYMQAYYAREAGRTFRDQLLTVRAQGLS